MSIQMCKTVTCDQPALPGQDYCLACLASLNGNGSDGAAMSIPQIGTVYPCVVRIEGDLDAARPIAELQARLDRLNDELDQQRERNTQMKAELNRQREVNQNLRGDLLRAEYAVEKNGAAIPSLKHKNAGLQALVEQLREDDAKRVNTIQGQAEIIRRQQAKLDGRLTAIRALRVEVGGYRDGYLLELEYSAHLSQQLEQLRVTLMASPLGAVNSSEEWAQTEPDDVALLEQGYRAQYAKLDPETFEINRLFWRRAD